MANILYLTHRMPFPPDKGDKITTYNFLRHLSTKHRVFLGAFSDDEADDAHVDKLRALCAEVKLVRIAPRWRRLWSARAIAGDRSISEVYHRSPELQAWVDLVMVRERIVAALSYCSAMAPYVADPRFAGVRRVTHYADVDSEKWRSYAEKHTGPMHWLYAREARTLFDLERRMSGCYDVTTFVNDGDATLYRSLAPELAAKVGVIPNGVDTAYFDPDIDLPSPYPAGVLPIVFTGAMDYWPNADAVTWFADEVFPTVRQQVPQAEFWIVGSKPAKAVMALGVRPAIRVTGRVPDVRPYLSAAGTVVAPLRIARGVQNKILEAYSMARSVVMTRAAASGLLPASFIDSSVEDDPVGFADAVLRALSNPPDRGDVRSYVLRHYSWQAAFEQLDAALAIDIGATSTSAERSASVQAHAPG